jgi:TPR repeat protein
MACQDEGYAKYNSGDLLGSAKAWDRSCDMGLMDSCALAGESYNLSKDTKTAYSRFKKGCENGSLLACYGYGALIAKPFYMESRVDYKIDMEEGLSYLQKACQGGIDDACTRWTKAYGHGGGIDVSAEAVYAMRGEACRISQKASDCGQYYQLVYDGEGGPQDKARAVPELRKACRGGNQLACKFLDRNNHSR